MANRDVVIKAIAETTKNLIREKSVEKITVAEICEKTDVNPRTFYRYFKDKHEVVEWIYSNSSLTKNMHHTDWSFWDYFPYIAKLLYDDRLFYRHAFQYHGQNSFRQYSILQLSPILKQDYGTSFPDEASLNYFIDQICNMAFDSFVIWLSSDPCQEPEKFVAYFRSCFFNVSRANICLLSKDEIKA